MTKRTLLLMVLLTLTPCCVRFPRMDYDRDVIVSKATYDEAIPVRIRRTNVCLYKTNSGVSFIAQESIFNVGDSLNKYIRLFEEHK